MAEKFKYIKLGHSPSGCGEVVIELTRKEGIPLFVGLSTEDARRLIEDLPHQIKIANHKSN